MGIQPTLQPTATTSGICGCLGVACCGGRQKQTHIQVNPAPTPSKSSALCSCSNIFCCVIGPKAKSPPTTPPRTPSPKEMLVIDLCQQLKSGNPGLSDTMIEAALQTQGVAKNALIMTEVQANGVRKMMLHVSEANELFKLAQMIAQQKLLAIPSQTPPPSSPSTPRAMQERQERLKAVFIGQKPFDEQVLLKRIETAMRWAQKGDGTPFEEKDKKIAIGIIYHHVIADIDLNAQTRNHLESSEVRSYLLKAFAQLRLVIRHPDLRENMIRSKSFGDLTPTEYAEYLATAASLSTSSSQTSLPTMVGTSSAAAAAAGGGSETATSTSIGTTSQATMTRSTNDTPPLDSIVVVNTHSPTPTLAPPNTPTLDQPPLRDAAPPPSPKTLSENPTPPPPSQGSQRFVPTPCVLL